MAGALSVRVDAGDFERLRPRTRDWEQVLQGQLRAELGAAARGAAQTASRAALRLRLPGLPPSAHPGPRRSTGLRSDLARSVTVILRAAGAGIEYRIRADHPMANPTNAASFRHPVYGNRDVWVTQASQPWWNLAMARSRPQMEEAAQRALERAARRIG